MPKIRIRYLSDKIEKLRYIDGKSDWIDLRAAETVELKAGESRYIPLGVAMVLPQGYEAHVLPRSSTFRNYGILMSNSMKSLRALRAWAFVATNISPFVAFSAS